MSNNDKSDTQQSDRSKLEEQVGRTTPVVIYLNSKYVSKLYDIMSSNDHYIVSDTVRMLIDTEYNKIQENKDANIRV